MEEDDFGDLYGDQTPGFSSIGDGSLQKTYPGYAIYDDDEDEGFAVTPAVHSHPPHGSSNPHGPSKLPEVRRYPDWPAERDSDEDDDMLLLGYNSKSGSASGKIQASIDTANNLQVPELENFQEGFPELAEPARVQNITHNGAISPSAGSNTAVTGYVPGDMPKQDIDLAGHNPLDDPNRSPDVGDLTNHTLSIPGLSTTMNVSPFDMGNNGDVTEDVWEQRHGAKAHLGTDRDAAAEGAEDWDTDSEDDLRIVLNTEYPYYTSGDKARVGRYEGGSEDEDEDLIIVAGGEPVEEGEEQSLQPPDIQAAPGDGSIHPAGDKQAGDVDEKGQQDKAVSGVATLGQSVSRVGYGYHSYNSPYKYVRPGAAPLYGTGVAPAGQAPGSRVGLLKGVNGRGDWRGSARGSYGPQATSQLSLWATQSGYEYTLPSSMTVFDIDLEAFDEKPWRQSAIAIDVTDFFNFGFDETTWKDYCKQLAQLRLESTMQSKIRVYESGRSEQEYDPDLPPELAVAAGLHEVSDRNQRRLIESEATATAMGRRGHTPMIPLGRPIEVEGGLGDRRPSSDLRKQRIRDSDSIILIDAMEEEELEAQRLHGENTRGMGGEADKEDEMDEEEEEEEQQQEEEEEEQVVEVTKSTFKPQQQMWRKEQMFGSKNHVSRGANISPMESSQKISEERLRTGFNPSAFSTDQNMQAHPLAGKPVVATESGKFSGESISATHRETSSRLRTASKLLAEERRVSDQIPSQSGGLCQDAENSPKSLNDDGESHVKKHTCKEEQIQSQEGSHAGDDASPNKHQTDRSTGQRVSDLNATTSREVFTQDNVPQEVQANSPECSSKRQRLVSPEGSHTASWDNYDVQKSTRNVVSKKESRDSGESARYGQEDGSQYRKNHKSYSDMSRGDQHRGSREGSDSHRKKQAFTLKRHDLENEIHSYADNLQETRKRPKQGIMEKDTEKELSRHWNDREGNVYAQSKGREEEAGRRGYLAKEVVHYKEKTGNQPESRKKDEEDKEAAYYKDRGGNRPESRKKDEEDREAAYYKDRGGNRPESKKREEEDRRDRQASRKRDVEDGRDRLDRGFQHREKEVEPLNWRSSERKKREEEYRRRDWSEEGGGHDKKEKEKHISERHDRDFDQHLRRKEEESWKRERLEDHHRSKARDGSLRDKEDSRQRNGEYQDPHGRAYKDEERAAQAGRSSRRHDEDRSWRGRDESHVSERTRSAEPRSYTKDKRKDLDDYGKDKSRSHEGSARSVSDREGLHLLESRDRDSGKHGRLSDDLRTSERRLHLDKHRSDAKRSKDSDKETNDSASQLGEYSNASRKRKATSDKYETAIRKGQEDPLTSRTRDSQASVTRAHPKETKEERNFQGAEKGSSEDDERQKGRSKLERWMSHKDLEFDASARLPSHVKLKKDEKHRQSSVFREKQRHDPSKLHDDSDQENQQLAGIDRKAGNASVIEEQVNGKVPKPNEKGDPIVQSKEVHADTEDTDYVELPEHHQHDPSLPRTNMAAKLEKRKERFKVSVEEKDLLKRLDYEDHQLTDKDESRQERPPRKRRWASG